MTLKPHPDVVIQEVQDELVLLHLGTEQYFGLEKVGMQIWHLLRQGLNREAILDRLGSEYSVDREQLAHDLDELLLHLLEHGLLQSS